jgi:protein-tyrosine-phosphatase
MNLYPLKKTKILVVSKNNYSRGPLVEKVLEKNLPKDKFLITSAGVEILNNKSIDPKTEQFLIYQGYPINSIFKPKKLTAMMLKNNDHILVLDHGIYDDLKKRFPDISKKLKLFNSPEPNNSIHLNCNMSDDNIELVMKNLLFFSLIWADYFKLGES